MAFDLIELDTGGVSLEFAEDDIPHLREAIRRLFGPVETEKGIIHDTLRFGGSAVLYYHEWEDLCLIASDEKSISNLKLVYAQLSTPTHN